MKTCIITGCLGFIGSHFTRLCLNMGWYVYGIDKITYAATPKLLNEFNKYPNFTFEKLDINDLTRLIDCDYFVNFCAESHVDNSIINSKEFISSNINGVYNILQLFRSYKSNGYKIPMFVHTSTDETYGDISIGSHVETDLLKPSNPYSASKASADMLILAWSRTFNIPYIIVRPTNNYGTHQYIEKLIPKTCKYLTLGRRIDLHNNGLPKRVWLNAHDTSQAILTIIRSGKINEIYNISGNYEDSNINVVTKIINCYLKRDINTKLTEEEISKYIDFNCKRLGQDVRYSLDDSKLKSLGWNCKMEFDKELPGIISYYKNNFIW